MKIVYYYVMFENVSPLHIGNGDNIYTDLDIIKDKNNQFYIPGSSLAGSIAHSLNEDEKKLFMPKLNNGQDKLSPFIINDARLCKGALITEVRDGILLNDDKTTAYMGKYDYEVVAKGHCFQWIIEIVDRDQKAYESLIEKVFERIESQYIKIGYKTTRGLGRLKIIKIGKKVFEKNNFDEYFKFDRYNYEQYDPFKINKEKTNQGIKLEISLQQKGGISIRTYNTSKDEVDYEHIYSQGYPIIPATSWNGLLRKNIENYIKKFNLSIKIKDIFGDVYKENQEIIKIKSKVSIDESVLDKGKDIIQTRIRIDPFYSGIVNGSLYQEKSYYHGITTLTINLSESIKQMELVKKLFILTFIDLNKGFIALGGETSIGRGLFDVKEIKINDQKININDYIKMEDYTC